MTEIFFRSDFDFLINLRELTGALAEGLAGVDFEGVLRTSASRLGRSYRFGRAAGVCSNCEFDAQSSTVRVICDSHGLGAGELTLELTVHFPDPAFPDGLDSRTRIVELPIVLTTDPSTGLYGTAESVAVTLPYVYASAYDLAVSQGYRGTAEEYWTATLDIIEVVAAASQTLADSQQAANEAVRIVGEAQAAMTGVTEATAAANEAATRAINSGQWALQVARDAAEQIDRANAATTHAQDAAAAASAVVGAAETFARKDRSNTFTSSQTISGTLTVEGDIVVNGETYVVQAEEVRSANDRITMRDGAVGGLGAHAYSGFEIVRYNGADNCLLAVNAQGEARVGDYGMGIDDTQPLLTREETANLRDGDLLMWDASRMCAVPLRVQPIDLEATYEDDPEHPVTYWLVSLPGYVPPTTNA